jgi:hypothetical protein
VPGLEVIPLRIPDRWDPVWFERFILDVLAKADVRNAIPGPGISIDGTSDTPATISGSADVDALLDENFILAEPSVLLANARVLKGEDHVIDITDTGPGGVFRVGVAPHGISFSKMRTGAGCSVIGRAADTTGEHSSIVAAANDRILRRVSDTVSFGQLTVGMAPNGLWTLAKLDSGVQASLALADTAIQPDDLAALVLDDLADVNAPSPSDGDVLTWDADESEWIAAASSGLTFPILAPDGSAAAPSYSFESDPDTGFYRIGADTIGISLGGSAWLSFSPTATVISSAQILFGDGSVSAPVLAFGNDSDTGIFRDGANTLWFSTAGTARAAFNTTALAFLNGTVITAADGSASLPGYTFTNDPDTGIYRVGADHLGFAGAAYTFNNLHGASAGNILSGTYTPTLTAVSGVSSLTANPCQYIRVGNVVTVSGSISGTDSIASCAVGVTLPIASNLTAANQCSGAGIYSGGGVPISVAGDATNDRAHLQWIVNGSSGSFTAFFTFTYLVQ